MPRYYQSRNRSNKIAQSLAGIRNSTFSMRYLIIIIWTVLQNFVCFAQQLDTIIKNDTISYFDFGKDSLYEEQLILKSKQGTMSDCEFAVKNANHDFEESNFSFHSGEYFPIESTYLYVLRTYYKIMLYFTNDLFSHEYYKCYDSIMTINLKTKYGGGFQEKAKAKSDSLENLKNWRKDAEFPGGQDSLIKYINNKLLNVKIKTNTTQQKILVSIDIDSTGKVENPFILRGINYEIDNLVLLIMTQLPHWEPAYLFGKPIRQRWTIPVTIDNLK